MFSITFIKNTFIILKRNILKLTLLMSWSISNRIKNVNPFDPHINVLLKFPKLIFYKIIIRRIIDYIYNI